jgi:hypothetical protein
MIVGARAPMLYTGGEVGMPLAGLLLRHRLRNRGPISSPALGTSGILKREAQ